MPPSVSSPPPQSGSAASMRPSRSLSRPSLHFLLPFSLPAQAGLANTSTSVSTAARAGSDERSQPPPCE